MTDIERYNTQIQREVEYGNSQPGILNKDHFDSQGNIIPGDGIECEICKNRGYLYVIKFDDKGRAQRFYMSCECVPRRMAVRRIRESGLGNALKRYTFESFTTDQDWQKRMKDTAMRYLRDGVRDGAWMYVGGMSGCGKSHLCTATAGVILRKLDLRYVVWPRFAPKAKSFVTDDAEYEREVDPLRTVRVLYVDDMFKPTFGSVSSSNGVSAADVRLAFDILNARYIDRLPTIISSEWYLSELGKIDQAVAGRIIEMTGQFRMDIKRIPERNMRVNSAEI